MPVIGLLFLLGFGTALGGTLDQKVPAFHDAVDKYIVQADHSAPEPFEDKEGVAHR